MHISVVLVIARVKQQGCFHFFKLAAVFLISFPSLEYPPNYEMVNQGRTRIAVLVFVLQLEWWGWKVYCSPLHSKTKVDQSCSLLPGGGGGYIQWSLGSFLASLIWLSAYWSEKILGSRLLSCKSYWSGHWETSLFFWDVFVWFVFGFFFFSLHTCWYSSK